MRETWNPLTDPPVSPCVKCGSKDIQPENVWWVCKGCGCNYGRIPSAPGTGEPSAVPRREPDGSPYPDNPGATHWEGCWRHRGHHNCAVAMITALSGWLQKQLDDARVAKAPDVPPSFYRGKAAGIETALMLLGFAEVEPDAAPRGSIRPEDWEPLNDPNCTLCVSGCTCRVLRPSASTRPAEPVSGASSPRTCLTCGMAEYAHWQGLGGRLHCNEARTSPFVPAAEPAHPADGAEPTREDAKP